MIEIYIPIFNFHFRCYNKDIEGYQNLVKKASGYNEYEINIKHTDGCTCPQGVFDDQKLCYIMWVQDGSRIDVFMHELYHLINAVDREFQIGEEACAYIIEYIIREFNKSFEG